MYLETQVFDLVPGPLAVSVQGIDLLKDRQALQRLTEAAEKAKIELSGVQEAGQMWFRAVS